MGRTTSALLVALAVVVTASLLVLVSGNNEEAGIVPGPGAEGTVVGTSAGSPINLTSEGGYTPLPPDTVRIWDSRKQYGPGLRMTLVEWVDREDWIQVPYGTTGVDLLYDTVLEGDNFYLDFAWGNTSAPKLYAKKMADGTPSRRNKLYGVFLTGGLALFTGETEYVRVLASGPDEATIEFRTSIDRYPQGDQVTRWRVLGGKPWMEMTPVEHITMLGMHGESRIVICPEAGGGGQDYLYDALKHPEDHNMTIWTPAASKMLLDFIMDDDTIWVLIWTPVAGQNQRCELSPYNGAWHSGWSSIGEGDCSILVSASFAHLKGEKVAIGIQRIGHWNYQRINATVQAGEDYNGNFTYAYQGTVTGSPFSTNGPWWPMYPGKWRMVGCIDGQYYTQETTVTQADVGQSSFTFHCPVAGTLEYVMFYLYDRTDQTPPNLYTVMDIYRGAIQPVAGPVGRYVFYNNSSFDGDNPAANADDDDAIATDKSALLPGLTAAFANYTSYSRGINGIMVDIPDLPTIPEITASDFTFKAGNDNNPDQWADAAAPSSVTVRRGAGVDGSDRVTVIWADVAIQKEWLQVTVKANLATLLASPDVFYFGNAMGDSGNSTTDTAVNTMDEMRARLDPHKTLLNPADIENPHDYNRSGVVSTMDEMIARLNNTTMLNDLNLITAP